MKEIDAVIDSDPTEQRIIDLAEFRNRNLMAFKELQSYNDTGQWLNKHPLLTQHSIRYKYLQILEKDPGLFLSEYTNTANNVSRYASFLNNSKRSDEQHEKDRKNLKKHQERESIMKEILDEFKSQKP
ncbi:MAG: hypothetical protein AB2L24_21825 [Mangrovibacterium sp.]